MKKTVLFGLLALLPLTLASCGESSSTTSSSSSTRDSSVRDTTTAPQEEDFTIQTSDNGLSAASDSYLFSTQEPGDQFPPALSIRLTTDQTWNGCTGLLERATRIVAEDESVLPEGSATLDIVTNSDIVGSSGSNEIAAIDIDFDRSLIRPGTSRLKVQVQPGNGNSSMNRLTTICLNIEVKEFGTIEVDTYDVSMSVDLTGLEEIIAIESETPTEATLVVSDADPIYGYTADDVVQLPIPLAESYGTVTIESFKFAVGHTYGTYVMVDGEEVSDRIWISLVSTETSSAYRLEPQQSGNSSLLTVEEDNAVVKARLGQYYAL